MAFRVKLQVSTPPPELLLRQIAQARYVPATKYLIRVLDKFPESKSADIAKDGLIRIGPAGNDQLEQQLSLVQPRTRITLLIIQSQIRGNHNPLLIPASQQAIKATPPEKLERLSFLIRLKLDYASLTKPP